MIAEINLTVLRAYKPRVTKKGDTLYTYLVLPEGSSEVYRLFSFTDSFEVMGEYQVKVRVVKDRNGSLVLWKVRDDG